MNSYEKDVLRVLESVRYSIQRLGVLVSETIKNMHDHLESEIRQEKTAKMADQATDLGDYQ